MVLKKVDERSRLHSQSGLSAALLLPRISLALEEVAVLNRGDELLRGAQIVAVVGGALPGQRGDRAVVIVVVPERVEAVSSLPLGAGDLGLLGLVLRHQDDLASARR